MHFRFSTLFFGCLAVIALATPAQVKAQPTPAPSATAIPPATPTPSATAAPNRWQVLLTPYIWGPSLNASFHFEGPDIQRPSGLPPPAVPTGANVTISAKQALSSLNFAAMFTAEIRRDYGGFLLDFINLNASSNKAEIASLSGPGGILVVPVNVSTSSHLSSTLATLALTGSPFATSGPSPLEGLVGFRYASIRASADWTLTGPLGLLSPNGSASKTEDQLLPIIGIKGRLPIGPHFFVPYYTDYGANGELTSWQGILGVGYGYHSGAVSLVYRDLGYFAQNQPSSLIQNLHLAGPAVGWTFNL